MRQALRDLQILLHMRRLYHHSHPKNLESLDTTFASLQRLTQKMNGLEIRVERESLVVPKLSEAPLPDTKGELQHLAGDFQLAGIQTLVLLRQFHVGELDTLAQLIRGALLKSKEPAKNFIRSIAHSPASVVRSHISQAVPRNADSLLMRYNDSPCLQRRMR